VGVVADIKLDSKNLEILVSDGWYTMLYNSRLTNDAEDSTDGRLVGLIKRESLYCGMKIHFVNQGLKTIPGQDLPSSVFFIQKSN